MPIRKYPIDKPVEGQNTEQPEENFYNENFCQFCGRKVNWCKCDESHDEK
jgi:hypothetical protein